jgi:hypothetical protein
VGIPRPIIGSVALVGLALLVASCTPTDDATTSTEPPTTTSTPTTTTTRPAAPPGPLSPPELPDPADIAAERITAPSGYTEAESTDLFTDDAAFAIGTWLPDPIVAGTASRVLVDDAGESLVVVSVVPTMAWRGDPGLVPALADLDGAGREVADGVHRSETASGLVVHLWSDGDGFVVAASLDEEVARSYLVALESGREPQTAWSDGSCLYLEPESGLPWAPFPADAVVPCDGPHNAEVIAASQVADGLDRYDEDEFSYLRNYRCDRAYEQAMGPQRDRSPALITYMPDGDEHERGDRYEACVIQLESAEGPVLVAGRITERTDLVWTPRIGECFLEGLPPEATDCGDVHAYEFVAEVEYDGDEWPDASSDAFAEACSASIDALPAGPAPIDVFPTGLYPYAFEQGERSIRCMAFALGDTGVGRVIGSFTGTWRILATGGLPA